MASRQREGEARVARPTRVHELEAVDAGGELGGVQRELRLDGARRRPAVVSALDKHEERGPDVRDQ
eukprot:3392283-Rhodomonas_salina.1